jgi:hypothetical protein
LMVCETVLRTASSFDLLAAPSVLYFCKSRIIIFDR